MPLTLTTASPTTVPDNGGAVITLLGTFDVDVPTQIYVVVNEVDIPCYGAQSGRGQNPLPDSPTQLRFATPALPIAGPYDIKVVQGVEEATLAFSLSSVARSFHSAAFDARRMFPRWYATGRRDTSDLGLLLRDDTINIPHSIGFISDASPITGVPYAFTPSVINPDGNTLVWAVFSGSLPAWTSLDTVTGTISGTPPDNTPSGALVLSANDGVLLVTSNAFNIDPIGSSPQTGAYYAFGVTKGNVEFDNPLGANQAIAGLAVNNGFLCKYNSDTSLAWVVRLVDATYCSIWNAVVTPDGGIAVVGRFNSTITLYDTADNPTAFTASTTPITAFWAKYDADGNPLWFHSIGWVGAAAAGTSDANLGGISISRDGTSLILGGRVQRPQSGGFDLDLGNGVTIPGIATTRGPDLTPIHMVVNESDGLTQRYGITRNQRTAGAHGFQRGHSIGHPVSNETADGKISIQSGIGIEKWGTATVFDVLLMEGSPSPLLTREFARIGIGNGNQWAPFLAQVNAATLSPDWVLTVGDPGTANVDIGVADARQIQYQIARDDAGTTYFFIETPDNPSAGAVLNRDPTPLVSPFALTEAKTVFLFAVDNLGAILWSKKIKPVGPTGRGWSRPAIFLSGSNLAVMWRIPASGVGVTFAAGDVDQVTLAPNYNSGWVAETIWRASDGLLLSSDKHVGSVASNVSVDSASTFDGWESGPEAGRHVINGNVALVTGAISAEIGPVTITGTFPAQPYMGYIAVYDSAGVQTRVHVYVSPTDTQGLVFSYGLRTL